MWFQKFIGQNCTTLDCEKMGEVGEESANKSNHTKSSQFGSRGLRDSRYSCIWRCKFAWNMCSSICSNTKAIWNQTRINHKQIKIVKEVLKNTKTGISTQHILNLADNIRNSLPNYNVGEVHGWSDSAVVFAQLTRRWK